MSIPRQEIIARLQAQQAAGRPIVGCGAGTGISAKFAEAGGADLIIIYNSGRFRMAGRGSLSGMMPYVGLLDGTFRENLEGTGMGYDKEVEAIAIAHQLDMFTAPYVFTPEEATAMAEAGADLLVAHVGLTTAGTIGAAVAFTLEEAVEKVQEMAAAGRRVNPDQIVICHGGPFDEPENVGTALQMMPGIAGFFGASSIERLPTERAIRGQVVEFKALILGS